MDNAPNYGLGQWGFDSLQVFNLQVSYKGLLCRLAMPKMTVRICLSALIMLFIYKKQSYLNNFFILYFFYFLIVIIFVKKNNNKK